MYEVGDKYGVHGLKELSREKFSDDCKPFWEAEGFAVAAKHAFSTTPEDNKGLRKVVLDTILQHMGLIRKPEIQALMLEFSGLAVDILLKRAGEHPGASMMILTDGGWKVYTALEG
jgi:hypothetical protein